MKSVGSGADLFECIAQLSLLISFVAMKLLDLCKPHLFSRYFMGWLCGYNEVVPIKHLAWFLARNKCSIKVTCHKYCQIVILTVTEDGNVLEGLY